MFKPLDMKNIKNSEDKINEYWDSINIYQKIIATKEKDPNFVFFEGPPTANNLPGIHHVMARGLKDCVCKYKTMQGYKVIRKAGWDTHGLPVELEVEKELALHDKTEIEKYGIKAFNEKCKESVWKYKTKWEQMTKEMGYFIDMNDPYVTFDNNYIETEWYILKKFFDAGLIYEGHKILPYCTRCGTGLASHEVAQGYEEDEVMTVTVLMKLKEEDTYLLVWTTTPWTLLANVAVCVNPDCDYVKVKSQDNYFILAKDLVSKTFGEDVEIVTSYKGTDLEYKEYEQLMPFLKLKKKGFYITCDNYVTTSDGTGIVHLAPAFGEDDYNVSKKYDLDVINPVGEDGKYLEGPLKGMYVMDANQEVIKYLKENNKLFKKEKIKHNYPHCWRCKTPLLYYARPSWYIKMTALKDKLVKNNNTVNWYPDYVGEKRFGNWLANINDWAISRSRYWGTPLNIWKCECGHLESIGSIEELKLKATSKFDNIELHRPYVDEVHLKCPHCGKEMTRVKDVIDCWFDSGSMPYAQYHYPFENKELFEQQFPADFICEGIDQTRGWFYSLLAISTFLKDQSPYKNVLVNDHLLDKDGFKMSKSRGNGVNPFELFKEYGADISRWYLLYVSPVWIPTRFDYNGLKEISSKFFGTLKNTYTFFTMYANIDNIDPTKFKVNYQDLEDIDKWIISKYNNLVKDTTEYMDKYDLNKVVHFIQDFVVDDFSNWYIRRNRRRFWESNFTTSKQAVYQTTYDILIGIAKLIAPMTPFLSEEIYRNLTNEVSVHLSSYPKVQEELIDNKLEEKMDLVIDLISLGRNAREEAKIKIRQPIQDIILESDDEDIIKDMEELIKEELNIKNIIYSNDIYNYINTTYKPNYKIVGTMLGKDVKDFANYLENLTDDEEQQLRNGTIDIKVKDNVYTITPDMIIASMVGKEGYMVATDKDKCLVINTNITNELKCEGLAREFISKVQNIRKTSNYDISDRIDIMYDANEEFIKSITSYIDFIKEETLAINITLDKNISDAYDINSYEVKIKTIKTN